MTMRPAQPEPFLRGCLLPAVADVPYPRADPATAEQLPADVWATARLPVGVRLEFVGSARTVRVWYRTTTANLGYRGEAAGCSFVAYREGRKIAEQEAELGEGMVELELSGPPNQPVIVYFPEGMAPVITGVAGVDAPVEPAPRQPRWLAFGDAITQGWLASGPALAWPAVAGRKLGLEVCNLGYGGSARGDMTSALLLANTPAEIISIAFGMNAWSRVPHTPALLAEEVRAFVALIRRRPPTTVIVVVSPSLRPDAEGSANALGATLADLRSAMESAVRELIDAGDDRLFLVEGASVFGADDLADGVYPSDEGHKRLAAAFSKHVAPLMGELRTAAATRLQSAVLAVGGSGPDGEASDHVSVDVLYGPGVAEPEPAPAEAALEEPALEEPAARRTRARRTRGG